MQRVLTNEEPPWGSVWTPVYEMLGHDFLYPDPMNLVIMPDNHDMSRIFTQVGEDVDLWRMAMAFYATMRGIPQIFYGTEVLMSHPGTTSHGAIREEFPGGWDDHDRNAFTGDGLKKQQRAAQDFLRRLLNWRKDAAVVHRGKTMHFVPEDRTYVYFRYDDEDSVMVVLNKNAGAVELELERFAERLKGYEAARDVVTGEAFRLDSALPMPGRSVRVLELN